MNFRNIPIGQIIQTRVIESGISLSRICNFLKTSEDEIAKMYEAKGIDTELLLKWSKLLEYDFFRIYSQHLILFSPASADEKIKKKKTSLPQFRKNIYTKEIIDFILEQVRSGAMSKSEIVEKYRIPKTTLHKWINKYGK